MTKEEKMYEVYGGRYDWDENGWLLYGCDEATESGFEPFGEYETKNHIDGYYEWRPIELQGIETNNGWIKIESEDNLPKSSDDVEYYVIDSLGMCQAYFNSTRKLFQNEQENIKSPTHYQPIQKPQPPIY